MELEKYILDTEKFASSTPCTDCAKEQFQLAEWLKDYKHLLEKFTWIPFETRELTEEEKLIHPGWNCMLCGHLPDHGQKILVSIQFGDREYVQSDLYLVEDGVSKLASGYAIAAEVSAWMPSPEPYYKSILNQFKTKYPKAYEVLGK